VAALAFHLAHLVRFDPKPSSCGNTYVAPPKLTLATPRRLLLTGLVSQTAAVLHGRGSSFCRAWFDCEGDRRRNILDSLCSALDRRGISLVIYTLAVRVRASAVLEQESAHCSFVQKRQGNAQLIYDFTPSSPQHRRFPSRRLVEVRRH